MSKESLVYQAEANIKKMAEYGFKRLFTTHGFRLLGFVTWDKKVPDESLGLRRRKVKGLVFENGTSLSSEERIFETFLDRKNPRSGKLEDIVVHEDDFMILMERKTFDLSDEDDNFQFIPNMHALNHVQQLMDKIDAANRRLGRSKEEKDELFMDCEHFKGEAAIAKEKERTLNVLVNRLTREVSHLQERNGNLEANNQMLMAKNIEYESFMDETTANASEKGTLKGMTTHDMMIHAASKEKELSLAMHEIGPESESTPEHILVLQKEMERVKEALKGRLERETPTSKTAVQT